MFRILDDISFYLVCKSIPDQKWSQTSYIIIYNLTGNIVGPRMCILCSTMYQLHISDLYPVYTREYHINYCMSRVADK